MGNKEEKLDSEPSWPAAQIFDLGFLNPLVVVAIEREGKTGPILAFPAI